MIREETLFSIHYSYYLEGISSTLFSRIDKSLIFLLFLLGSSVMASVGNSVAIGFCIAVIAAIQNSFKFSAASEVSLTQSMRYLDLYARSGSMDDEALSAFYLSIQKNDAKAWMSLEHVAEYRSGLTLKGVSTIKLNYFERFLSFLC